MIKGNKADFMIIDENPYSGECIANGTNLRMEDDLTLPHEERKQLRLKRKADVKDRDLDRRQKRQDKRRQFY